MKKLIHEAHRRSLWQVLGIYLAGSWIALQVVAQLADSVGFPDWVEPFALVLLVIGLPIVMATAFVQEGVAPAKAVPGDSEAGAEPMMTDSGTVIQTAAADAPAPTGTRRLFSWRNALGGGALAFLFLVVVTIAWIVMRQAGIGPAGSLVARGVIDDRAPVIVADFSAQDSLLARAATEAFRVDLSQSPNVQVLEPAFLVEALDRMQVQRGASLDPELARELAVREGIPAVVVGEITPAGRGFILTSKLVDADDGSALTSVRETATDTAEVLECAGPAVEEPAGADWGIVPVPALGSGPRSGHDGFPGSTSALLGGAARVRDPGRQRPGDRAARGSRRDRPGLRDGVAEDGGRAPKSVCRHIAGERGAHEGVREPGPAHGAGTAARRGQLLHGGSR